MPIVLLAYEFVQHNIGAAKVEPERQNPTSLLNIIIILSPAKEVRPPLTTPNQPDAPNATQNRIISSRIGK
jgi:hypothetical protein